MNRDRWQNSILLCARWTISIIFNVENKCKLFHIIISRSDKLVMHAGSIFEC